jgi:predicted amidohydrolase
MSDASLRQVTRFVQHGPPSAGDPSKATLESASACVRTSGTQRAEFLINVAAGPARGASVDADQGLGSAASWGTLLRATAALTTSYVAFTNRVGVDESLIFWGGSRVIGPDGVVIAEAPLFDEALLLTEIDLDEVARARSALPLLRDERLELTRREFDRIIATRAGLEEA